MHHSVKQDSNKDSGMTDIGISMNDQEFQILSSLVYDKYGIHLVPEKRTMIAVRLQKTLRNLDLPTFTMYYKYLLADTNGDALTEFVNRITTNHTFFYRENEHFDFLVRRALPDILGKLQKERNHDVRVWSAGCSSGEEPYTLAMLMLEYFGSQYGMWDVGVLATDISEKVLKIARTGVYSNERIASLPATLRSKYFRQITEDDWEISKQVKGEVLFRRFNLMNEQFPFKKPFHVIFCRNVMIYFDQPTRDALIEKFYHALTPGGYLFVGHSETLGRSHTLFEYIMPAVYKRCT